MSVRAHSHSRCVAPYVPPPNQFGFPNAADAREEARACQPSRAYRSERAERAERSDRSERREQCEERGGFFSGLFRTINRLPGYLGHAAGDLVRGVGSILPGELGRDVRHEGREMVADSRRFNRRGGVDGFLDRVWNWITG